MKLTVHPDSLGATNSNENGSPEHAPDFSFFVA